MLNVPVFNLQLGQLIVNEILVPVRTVAFVCVGGFYQLFDDVQVNTACARCVFYAF